MANHTAAKPTMSMGMIVGYRDCPPHWATVSGSADP